MDICYPLASFYKLVAWIMVRQLQGAFVRSPLFRDRAGGFMLERKQLIAVSAELVTNSNS